MAPTEKSRLAVIIKNEMPRAAMPMVVICRTMEMRFAELKNFPNPTAAPKKISNAARMICAVYLLRIDT